MGNNHFFFGDWQVTPKANSLRQGQRVKQLEPKAMDVLLYLCRHPGQVVGSEELLAKCWPNIETGDNPLHKTITQLRAALGDKATAPRYIETIRKRGYRTLADVRFPLGDEKAAEVANWQGGSPFPGLQPYDAKHAGVFYGRGNQIHTLLERIHHQVKFGRDFCLVLGPSGCGKSSLIQAGIIPNLTTPQGYNGLGLVSDTSLDLADVSQGLLLPSLASALLDWELGGQPLFENESAESLAAKLAAEPDALLAGLKAALPQGPYALPRYCLFIDRLEVLLSSPLFGEAERQGFIALLDAFARSNAVLVLAACRNDFYPQLVSHPSLMAGKQSGAHFDLEPPGRSELLQMIRLPAQAAGLTFEQDPDSAQPLDELLCFDAAANPDVLPMLQYMLQQLYLARSEAGLLKVAVYRGLGGIEGAIGRAAEEALGQLSQGQRDALPRVLSLLVTLREDEQSITSRSARLSQLGSAEERALVQAMVEKRLFVSHLQQGEPSFGIAHEALLRRWPRASQWIADHKDSLAQQARLGHQARRWQQEAKAPAYLLPEGKPLAQAQALATNPLFSLEESEKALIAASAKKARGRRALKTGTVLLLGCLALVASLMSLRSVQAEKQATERRLAAEKLLGFMVGDFADKLRGIGRMDLLDGISSKALEYFTSTGSDDDNLGFDGRFQHGQTLEAMAEVAYSRGKTEEAKSALLAAQKELLPLQKSQPHNLELLKSLGANAYWLGQLRYDQADWPGAAGWFSQYLTYSQAMFDQAPQDGNALMELSYALNSLGSVQMKEQNFGEARQHFERSLALKEQALKQDPTNVQRMADVVDTRSWLASANSAEGRVKEALIIYEKNRQEFSTEHFLTNGYMLHRLEATLRQQALLLSGSGNNAEAISVIKEALKATHAALSQDKKNKTWKTQELLARLYLFNFCTISSCSSNYDTPQSLHRSILDFAKDSNEQRSTELLSIFYKTIALYSLNNHPELADNNISMAIELYEKRYKAENKKVAVSLGLAESYLTRSSIHLNLGEKLLSSHDCKKALSLLYPLVANNKSPSIITPYARALDCVGKLSNEQALLLLLKQENIPANFYTMTRK
ncbi:winged helix-turn-helix domain-containing protein [Gallaecimonas kandeliae]|uniref:nSTAND1 domain-containing NTPase n=1 Tax=Gallaecimonas kandeliae TaxID=3029055 RepID=UPI002648E951|nr:winged helix-turn-helix domain-containing protein [Gallaecimonas kandeliae]WKE66253.1 winged helix-turn-helix domain-containing protein [Gallaecimonas kandeliae]